MGLKLLYISSSQRLDYNTTNSNDFVVPCADSVYGSYRLKAISLPNTIYTIEKGINDSFGLNIPSIPFSTIIDVSSVYLSDGATLANVVQTAINGSGSPVAFTVTYDDLTSKLSIANTIAPFQLDFSNNYTNPINLIMGFGAGIYNSVTLPGPVYQIKSNHIVNLTRTPAIFITIEQANNYLQSLRSGVRYTFLIPNNVNSLYFIDSFFDQTSVFNQFAKELHVTLRDEQNRILDIQDVDWYMVLESIC